jgi:hypothetical protein
MVAMAIAAAIPPTSTQVNATSLGTATGLPLATLNPTRWSNGTSAAALANLANSSMPIANGSAAAAGHHPATSEASAMSSSTESAGALLNHTAPIHGGYSGFTVLAGSRTRNHTRAVTRTFTLMSRPTGPGAWKMNGTFAMAMNGTRFTSFGAPSVLEAKPTEMPTVSSGILHDHASPTSTEDAGSNTLVREMGLPSTSTHVRGS